MTLVPRIQAQQFYLMWEGQLTLLTEPTETAPGYQPRQFYLMQEGRTGRVQGSTTAPAKDSM